MNTPAPRRPNILLITSDQQHYDTLGFANPAIKTPNLDRLAREGANFTRAYCNNPVCSPSRSTIITGLYPAWHHCWTIGCKLPEDVPTIGDILHREGYATTLVGKAHFQPLRSLPDDPEGGLSLECQPTLRDLDFWRSFKGPWYGFDRIELARNHGDESHVGQHYALWMEEKGLKNWADYFQPVQGEPSPLAPRPRRSREGFYWERNDGHWQLPEDMHYSTWTAERSIANIEESVQQNKPFFLWSSFHDPHPPYVVPEPWASMYRPEDMPIGHHTPGEFDRMPPHFGMTQQKNPDFSAYNQPHGTHGFHTHLHDDDKMRHDMAIYYGMVSFMDQQIGRILDALDRLGIADNTIVVFTTDHGHYLGQHGLIAKGPFHYEDGIRLPFLVRYPGHVPAGMTSSSLQGIIDLAPTFLSAAGIHVPGLMQGVNQLPVWCGQAPSARDHIICENRHQPTAVHLRTFVDQRYKITLYRDHPYGELFDLKEDPGELRNLWDEPSAQGVKADLLFRFMQAEIAREPTRMQRIAGA